MFNINEEYSDWSIDLNNQAIEITPVEPKVDDLCAVKKMKLDNANYDITSICVEDVIAKNIENLTAFEIIHYEYSVIYYVQNLLVSAVPTTQEPPLSPRQQTIVMDEDLLITVIEYMTWVLDASELLARRIGQELLPIEGSNLVRSSYNFCPRNVQCKSFYCKNELPTCKDHHFVHTLVRHDIQSVILFLNNIIQTQTIVSSNDHSNLLSSIKTICFVMRHMSKEIQSIESNTGNNSEFYHRNNPADFTRKKNIKVEHKLYKKKSTGIRYMSNNNDKKSYFTRSNKFSILAEK